MKWSPISEPTPTNFALPFERFPATKEKRFWVLLLRGLFAGALAGFLFASLGMALQIDKFGSTWDQWLIVAFLVLGLPLGLAGGAITAITIWSAHRLTRINLGPLIRVIIGAFCGILACLLIFWLQSSERTTWSVSWRGLMGMVMYGILFGSLPGLAIGRQTVSNR